MSQSVTVIIPAFNAATTLERAVRSLLETDYADLEVVIVDDGSSDRTAELAAELAAREPGRVRMERHQDGLNRGVSASRNLGIDRSEGELVCFLDADDYVHPNRFEASVPHLRSDPTLDGVHNFVEVVFADDTGRDNWWSGQQTFGFLQPVAPEDLLLELLYGKCWSSGAILVRRTLLDRTGLFPEGVALAEDCDLWFRMAAVGRIASGDLDRPVGAYWRTTQSAYQPSGESRLHVVRAMAAFLRWSRGNGVDPAVRRVAKKAITSYVVGGVITVRSSGERDAAWRLASRSLRWIPGLVSDPTFRRQFVSLAVGR